MHSSKVVPLRVKTVESRRSWKPAALGMLISGLTVALTLWLSAGAPEALKPVLFVNVLCWGQPFVAFGVAALLRATGADFGDACLATCALVFQIMSSAYWLGMLSVFSWFDDPFKVLFVGMPAVLTGGGLLLATVGLAACSVKRPD
ncbi:hypothetical protein N0754_19070 [Pseudomonas aeruginosa]|nr:hypothetical protein [Pseudomonas aeruginosa]MCS9764340.1 hypothetical protein [Pseudomonas aeruginosa]MCS9820516.1 hypothetical protein [Pseudomonas aeruginosa]MCT0241097.1 hypothetical protein [Pseudomonas aeruginosa]MCT0528550.1 hypothetical protein [Pseudomonas aeruginosa]